MQEAEGSEQSAKACEHLSALALDLQKTVSQFRLENDGARDDNPLF